MHIKHSKINLIARVQLTSSMPHLATSAHAAISILVSPVVNTIPKTR